MKVIIVNTKAYLEGIAHDAVSLANTMQQVGRKYDVRMIIAVQPADIHRVTTTAEIDVFSQHVDGIAPGSRTGWLLPETIKGAGATGTLLNHSEHRMKLEDISNAVRRARQLGLQTVTCASTVEITKALACLQPDFVAIEPPELIGGDISVTSAQPEIVSDAVSAARGVNPSVSVLCGAGVKSGADVAKAVELGADGVLVASGVVKAENRENVLEDMARSLV